MYATAAIVVGEVISLLTSITLWVTTSFAVDSVIDNNNRLLRDHSKSAVPAANYGRNSKAVAHDVHSFRISQTTWGLLFAVVFILLAYSIWRGRGGYRWVYIVLACVPLFWFAPLWGLTAIGSGGPVNVLLVLRGIATLIAVVSLFLPSSIRYFVATKAERVPAAARAAGAGAGARPAGLRGLFGPVPPRGVRTTDTRPTATRTSGRRKPADTRPATRPAGSAVGTGGDTESTGRGKPKARTGAPGVDTATIAASSEPAGVAAGRSRGKSRRV
jgi:hypothetical protein